MANHRETGRHYEEMAAEYLESRGYRRLEQNYYTRWGEIDLIMEKEERIIFVEVKYRGSDRYGFPEEAVDFKKQQRILKSAQWYLITHRLQDRAVSLDVIAIHNGCIRHIPGAFDGKGNLWI